MIKGTLSKLLLLVFIFVLLFLYFPSIYIPTQAQPPGYNWNSIYLTSTPLEHLSQILASSAHVALIADHFPQYKVGDKHPVNLLETFFKNKKSGIVLLQVSWQDGQDGQDDWKVGYIPKGDHAGKIVPFPHGGWSPEDIEQIALFLEKFLDFQTEFIKMHQEVEFYDRNPYLLVEDVRIFETFDGIENLQDSGFITRDQAEELNRDLLSVVEQYSDEIATWEVTNPELYQKIQEFQDSNNALPENIIIPLNPPEFWDYSEDHLNQLNEDHLDFLKEDYEDTSDKINKISVTPWYYKENIWSRDLPWFRCGGITDPLRDRNFGGPPLPNIPYYFDPESPFDVPYEGLGSPYIGPNYEGSSMSVP